MEDVRNKILDILLVPSTVTEIKTKLPKVKSFGTIAYHLKNLEKENIITKNNIVKVKGEPIKYQILDKKTRDWYNKYDRERKKYRYAFLKHIRDNPNIEDEKMILDLKNQGYEEDLMGDVSLGGSNNNFSMLCHRITPKGLNFIKKFEKNLKQ
jgi:hypothetical protein